MISSHENGSNERGTCANDAPVSSTLLLVARGAPRALFVI